MPREPQWKVRNEAAAWKWLLEEAERRRTPEAEPSPEERRAQVEAVIAENKRTLDQRIKEAKQAGKRHVGSRGETPQQWRARKRAERRERDAQLVYFIFCEANGLTKIGTTSQLDRRLKALRGASPVELSLVWATAGGYVLENLLHERFAEHRRGSSEWFALGDDPAAVARLAMNDLG